MKKTASIIICFVIVCLTLCGCGSTSVISKAIKKTRRLDEISAQMRIEINMQIGENSVSLPVAAKVMAKNIGSKKQISLTELSMHVSQNEITAQMYKEGEWAYITVNDERYKTKVSETDSQYDYIDDINNLLMDIPQKTLNSADIKKEKGGKYILELVMEPNEFAEIYEDFMDDIDDNYGVGDGEAKISDASLRITVEKGYINSYNIYFIKSIDDGAAMVEVNAIVNYNKPGEKVEIIAPEGYDKYEEINNSSVEY